MYFSFLDESAIDQTLPSPDSPTDPSENPSASFEQDPDLSIGLRDSLRSSLSSYHSAYSSKYFRGTKKELLNVTEQINSAEEVGKKKSDFKPEQPIENKFEMMSRKFREFGLKFRMQENKKDSSKNYAAKKASEKPKQEETKSIEKETQPPILCKDGEVTKPKEVETLKQEGEKCEDEEIDQRKEKANKIIIYEDPQKKTISPSMEEEVDHQPDLEDESPRKGLEEEESQNEWEDIGIYEESVVGKVSDG